MKKTKPIEKPVEQLYCRDCSHAINPYCTSMATGLFIMAECELQTNHILLSFKSCINIVKIKQ